MVLRSRLPQWTVRHRPLHFPLGGHAVWISGLTWVVIVVIVGVPVANLVYQAGLQVTLIDQLPRREWSAARCVNMMVRSPLVFGSEWLNSLMLAQLVAVAVLAIASPLAWWSRSGGRRLGGVTVLTAVCLAVPAPLLAVGIIRLLNQPGWVAFNWVYDQTLVPVWIVQSVKALPLALLILWPAMRTVPDPLLDMARVDGWSRLHRYGRLGVRLTLPAHAVAWLVTAATSLAELAGTVLVIPPGFNTLSVTVFQLVHYGVEDRLAGLCLALWAGAIMLALAIGIAWISWRGAAASIMDER
jgi:iron(III) transport system permease protein